MIEIMHHLGISQYNFIRMNDYNPIIIKIYNKQVNKNLKQLD